MPTGEEVILWENERVVEVDVILYKTYICTFAIFEKMRESGFVAASFDRKL